MKKRSHKLNQVNKANKLKVRMKLVKTTLLVVILLAPLVGASVQEPTEPIGEEELMEENDEAELNNEVRKSIFFAPGFCIVAKDWYATITTDTDVCVYTFSRRRYHPMAAISIPAMQARPATATIPVKEVIVALIEFVYISIVGKEATDAVRVGPGTFCWCVRARE